MQGGWDVTGCDAERGAPAAVEEVREAREVGDREASGTLATGARTAGMDTLTGWGPWDGEQRNLGTHSLWSCRDVMGCCGRESCDLKDQLRKGRDCSIHQCLFCCLVHRVIVTIFLNSIYMR